MPFEPGKSGNPRGAKPGRKQGLLSDMLRRDVPLADVVKRLKYFLGTEDYGMAAIKEYFDRTHGKPVQGVAVEGEMTVKIKLIK